jgi:hypothetical protein
MNKPKNSPEKKPIGVLSVAALMALLLNACAGGAGNMKASESLTDKKDVDAFIAAAVKQNDVEAVMRGMRMKFAIGSGLESDAYPYNGIQDDGTVIKCAKSKIVDTAMSKAKGDSKLVFGEAHGRLEVRELIEKMMGGTLHTKVATGDLSGIESPFMKSFVGGKTVICAHAQERKSDDE